MADLVVLVVALGLALLLGFSAQQASLCTVRAVAELLSTRRALMLVSFVKTAVWVVLASFVVFTLFPDVARPTTGWPVLGVSLMGGFVFGMGAAVNGGCAVSTLTKLGNGRLAMLGNLAGFALGAAGFVVLAGQGVLGAPVPVGPLAPRASQAFLALSALFALWGVWEVSRLWRSRAPDRGWRARALADTYRLSTAALLIGLANGVLYALYGPWVYTSTVKEAADHVVAAAPLPGLALWVLFAAVIAGAALSAWQRGSFRIVAGSPGAWARHGAGGLLMGFGAAATPGGNDVLLLHSIPGLSPHGLPAFLAILVGIAVPLVAMKRVTGTTMVVDCSGDVCFGETMKRGA